MRFRLIACEVIARELRLEAARSLYPIDVEILPKALHDLGGKRMRAALQERIDMVESSEYSAVLMGYALCGNGLAGIHARSVPVVIPRAHDCIALLMGSRDAYDRMVSANPGTFFRSPGWVEHCGNTIQLSGAPVDAANELDWLIEKYGEEPGRYLYEELYRYRRQYSRLVYIETGVAPDSRCEQQAREEAENRQWSFEKIAGNRQWFRKLVTADWDDDFVVLQPGERSAARYDAQILSAEAVTV